MADSRTPAGFSPATVIRCESYAKFFQPRDPDYPAALDVIVMMMFVFFSSIAFCKSSTCSFFLTPAGYIIRKNGSNPIGFVKAGFILIKTTHFTIDPIFEGIFEITTENSPIRPVKKDEKG